MSVVIVGGNECMTRQYLDICKSYGCKAKCYHKMKSGLKNLGNPDLLVLFTGTMSHKMLRTALSETKEVKLWLPAVIQARQVLCTEYLKSIRGKIIL